MARCDGDAWAGPVDGRHPEGSSDSFQTFGVAALAGAATLAVMALILIPLRRPSGAVVEPIYSLGMTPIAAVLILLAAIGIALRLNAAHFAGKTCLALTTGLSLGAFILFWGLPRVRSSGDLSSGRDLMSWAPSPLAMLVLVGLCAACLRGCSGKARRSFSVSVVAVFLLSLAFALAPAYGATGPMLFGTDVSIPFDTAVALALPACATAATRPRQPPISRLTDANITTGGLIIAAALALPLLFSALSWSLSRLRVEEANSWAWIIVALALAGLVARWIAGESRQRTPTPVGADVALPVDAHGEIVAATRAAADKFGCSRESLVGSRLDHWVSPSFAPQPPEPFPIPFAGSNGGPRRNLPTPFGHRMDGHVFPVELRVRPFTTSPGRLGEVTVRDVSELERRTVELAFLDRLDQGASVGQVVLDRQGALRRVNPAFAELLGYRTGQLRGRTLLSFVDENDRERVRDLAAAQWAAPAGGAETVARFSHAEGRVVWVDLRFRLLRYRPEREPLLSAQLVDITARKRSAARMAETIADLQYRTRHDPLTGLRNRRDLLDAVEEMLRASRAAGDSVVVLYCDLDDFKAINDELSHRAGDEVLVEVAQRLTALDESACVARLGGDEFVFVQSGVASCDDAKIMAARLSEAVSGSAIRTGFGERWTSAGIGATVSNPSPTAESILDAADAALRQAKCAGRGRWVVCREAGSADPPASPPTATSGPCP